MSGIVVGVDGSPEAQGALQWALREARLRDATVTALLAWSADESPVSVARMAPGPGAHDIETTARQVLGTAIRSAADPRCPVPVVERVEFRDAAEALLAAAGTADLLVVGRHGMNPVRRILMGSVSAQCVHKATTPVVVTHGQVPAHGAVVVGVDGSPLSVEALRFAAREARLRGAVLRVVHAWTPVPVGYPAVYIGVDFDAAQKAARAVLDTCVAEGVGDRGDLAVEDLLVTGSATPALLSAAGDAQLLVVGSRGHGGFTELLLGSVSHQCLHHAPCPVAVVPAVR
ncbi:universal stress protein [Frankia sp. AgKG'84/4]|uniref:universal stress protein n=1 Tax=Frankia sp. AgKG'84/4 TaxID=573490 RepID=UPI00200DBD39|nr:universal stress protein [Frankia sp. AgKG'84/4]MCL9793460.1 universal stress protein [Frankia sp. AgKG'84/4]